MPDALARVLAEGLAQELRAEVAPPHPTTLPAALHHRRDARVTRHLVGARPALALRAQCRQQPRGIDLARAGQACEQLEVLVRRTESFDLRVELMDGGDG